jgi:hypothetical protein
VIREGVGAGGTNDPSLVAHMNNKTIKKRITVLEKACRRNAMLNDSQ